jgi:mercuric ion binding protein
MKTVKLLSVMLVVLLTSAQCEMCKESLQANVSKLNGVKKSTLDLKTKELNVKFDSSVVSLEEIKQSVSKTGYWADNVMPDKDAYAALPACCKPKKSCCAGGEKKSCSSSSSAESGEKKSCASTQGEGEQKKSCVGHSH